jgi:hypothetical protein
LVLLVVQDPRAVLEVLLQVNWLILVHLGILLYMVVAEGEVVPVVVVVTAQSVPATRVDQDSAVLAVLVHKVRSQVQVYTMPVVAQAQTQHLEIHDQVVPVVVDREVLGNHPPVAVDPVLRV